jgi:hypothetical protein
VLEGIGKRRALAYFDALDFRAIALHGSGNERALIKPRSRTDDMRKLGQLVGELLPILNSGALFLFENRNMRGRAKQIALQRILESVFNRERNYQRHHPGGNPRHRNKRDDRNNHLLAFSSQVSACDKKLKHSWITSRFYHLGALIFRSLGPDCPTSTPPALSCPWDA